jgi:hypothetical protein
MAATRTQGADSSEHECLRTARPGAWTSSTRRLTRWAHEGEVLQSKHAREDGNGEAVARRSVRTRRHVPAQSNHPPTSG